MKLSTRLLLGGLAASVLLGTIIVANVITSGTHFVPVGFGYYAVPGSILVGFAMPARDAVQDMWGRKAILVLILIGGGLSFAVSVPAIATASAAAFLAAEFMNFAVYTPIRSRGKFGSKTWVGAVAASNAFAGVMDSFVFISIAFSVSEVWGALPGQLLAKVYGSLIYLVIGGSVAYGFRKYKAKKTDDSLEVTA